MECCSMFNDVYSCTLVIFCFLLRSACKNLTPAKMCNSPDKIEYFITPNPLECDTEYLRVSVAERLDADQHPDIIPGLELTLAPLYFVVVCKELTSSWSNEDADSSKARKHAVCYMQKFKP